MNKAIARTRTLEQCEEILAKYVESGKTQREFCAERGIGVSTLQYWARRAESRKGRRGGSRKQELLEVEVVPKIGTGRRVGVEGRWYEATFANGRSLRMSSDFNAGEVAVLMKILEAR